MHLVSYLNREPSHVPSSLKSVVAFHTQQQSTNRTFFPYFKASSSASNHLGGGRRLRRAAEAHNLGTFGYRAQAPLAAPYSASQDSQDLCQHLILRLNLHTLLGLGAERLHVNRPEASTRCQQKRRHLSQQKVKDQGMWPF